MRKTIFIFALLIAVLSPFPAACFASNGQSGIVSGDQNLSSMIGLLKGITFNPSYIQTTKGKFQWNQESTEFVDEKGNQVTPRSFLKAYIKRGVMIFYNSEELAIYVKPINY